MNSPLTLRLVANDLIALNVRRLRFVRSDGERFRFRPGEFVSLQFPAADAGDEGFKRSYSIACAADAGGGSDTLEIVASHVPGGRATGWFWQATPGAELGMSGPHGQLLWPEQPPKRVIQIATGTGIAPYRSMLAQMQPALASRQTTVEVLFGVRDQAEAFYLDDFRQQAGQFGNFRFTLCVSRAPVRAADEFAGRVTAKLASLQADPQSDLVMLCGNPAMVDEIYDGLKAQGFGFRSVKREKYVFTRT